ncbi:hypothetical protein EDB85DRAFT_1955526 [Lactarius pseudohatsudake]|nr:hypothetical protein EDB85DRAFT_1955526 [Lactarius pseudohatsudake]
MRMFWVPMVLLIRCLHGGLVQCAFTLISFPIPVCGRLDKNTKWANPADRIPWPTSTVSAAPLTDSNHSQSKAMACVVVAIEDITSLQNLPSANPSTSRSSSPVSWCQNESGNGVYIK